MDPAVARALRALHHAGCVFGIASNAQDYTIGELGGALAQHGLSLEWFQPDLCFWSYEHGFSKPDPHVFQFLSTRLLRRGIAPAETVMVGDRIDNDIQPARVFGWKTWQVANPRHDGDGSWEDLIEECVGTPENPEEGPNASESGNGARL
jgi:FMN phosphatase YigB (HAD superfamily)